MSKRLLLLHRERAEGVDPRLLEFLDWWAASGPFPLLVDPQGGVRYDERAQLELYRRGATKAKSLAETPHGRGGAIDAHPCVVGAAGQAVAILNRDTEAYRTYGELGKARGLVWGGDWKSIHDGPHVEVVDWRVLPYPPKKGGKK